MHVIRESLGTLKGIEIFAIISMVLFIVIFTLMLIHTYSLRKDELREFGKLPLEDNEADQHEE